MRKNTNSTSAIAAAALLLSGTFAVAGDHTNVSRSERVASARVLSTAASQAAPSDAFLGGDVIDLEQIGGGGNSNRHLVKPPKPQPEVDDDKSGRFTGLCLAAPVLGQMFCWRG